MRAHQKEMRELRAEESMNNLFGNGFFPTPVDLSGTRVSQINYREASKVIMEYEWLQSMPHRFGYRVAHGLFFNEILGGALVYAQQQVRSMGLFDRDYGSRSIIQLSRGACAFWTPSGSATRLISGSCKILKSEGIVAVIAYCTPEAGEIGTIYQAAGFTYYGDTKPSQEFFLDGRWIGERSFAHKKSWIGTLPDHKQELFAEAFSRLKTRNTMPRFKYIRILKKSARSKFKFSALEYPKRKNAASPVDEPASSGCEPGASPGGRSK